MCFATYSAVYTALNKTVGVQIAPHSFNIGLLYFYWCSFGIIRKCFNIDKARNCELK